jgi:hypothetical protein
MRGYLPGLDAGDAAGLDLASAFLVSPSFSSFFPAEGLPVGDAFGLAAGDVVVVGLVVAAGFTSTGLFSGVLVHAPRAAAIAAKTVSRTDLLIVFPFLGHLSRFFQASRQP